MIYDLIVIGGGAGGSYAAIRLAEFHNGAKILILESAKKPLSKVEISGGGRCNVTHACFDTEKLATYYPRGHEVLQKPFRVFQPSDLIQWFKEKGVILKTEADGRMFPITDNSSTIIDCFMREMKRHNIQLWTTTRVASWHYLETDNCFDVNLFDGRILKSRFLLVSSGSDTRTWNYLKENGYEVIPPVPSLFTFNIPDKNLQSLMGISKEDVIVSIASIKMKESGPLLITHWGLSGPAILKLSAWGARELYSCGYVFDVSVNWLGQTGKESFITLLQSLISENSKKYIHNFAIKDFPSRLWKYLCIKSEIPEFTSGAEFGKKQMKRLLDVLTNDTYRVIGKSTHKEEFVTSGGISTGEIDLGKFESKKDPGLFFVGEVLNIDAVTGGFNFQAAWTGAFIAAKTISNKLSK